MTIDLIEPDWPAPTQVRAGTTTRLGGVSLGGFESLNLAQHVEDDPHAVVENRKRLSQSLALPGEPFWLTQIHGCDIALGERDSPGCQADGVYTRRSGVVCAVLTADCLPLLLTDRDGREVSAVHAGWRGLASGIIEQAVAGMSAPAESILAWMGPAIGPAAFEVGDEVREVFIEQATEDAQAFVAGRPGHWWADIYQLARQRLNRSGVGFISGGDYCTVADRERFFSYRRDGVTGRMASLIWLERG
ncbi:MAG: peptidoglycan editing factor PgeF [Candidatus Thiodiazotropha sp. (ex. Lucinisca nassula)]|nr:peptidoglycan editing factor PgeF [Candidatus Thiodiazotropha sp. (ex. Lucinisca nassula)]